MGNRVDTIFKRLERLLPPPDAKGWHFTRLQLEAAACGATDLNAPGHTPSQDEQADKAEAQLILGAKLERVDADPANWDLDNAVNWRLLPTADPGASGFFLDLWGRTLSVPRLDGEPDDIYARRIIADVSRSTTTNIGLADAIDAALGTTGTRVLDASSVLHVLRFNNGNRMNTGKKLNNGWLTTGSLWCCFIVQTAEMVDPAELPKFEALVNSRKAAGTRLIGILNGDSSTPIITAPTLVPAGSTFSASVQNRPLATSFTWTVVGGTILSGQGTNNIQVQAGPEGSLQLRVTLVEDSVTSPEGRKFVTVGPAIGSGITCSISRAFAGDGPFTASAPVGYQVAWSISSGYIVSGQNESNVIFAVGEASQTCTLFLTLTAAGVSQVFTHEIMVIPFTHSLSASTPSLSTNQSTTLEMDLGWGYDMESVSVNRPCWVRIYNTAAARAADFDRLITQDPPGTMTDLVWEGIFTPTVLGIPDTPEVSGLNGDSPRTMKAYLTVANLDTVAGVVTININRTETRVSAT